MTENESDRIRAVRDSYRAFASGDRELAERVLGDPLRFHAPPDPDLDRAGYFERCWPNAGGRIETFEFVRLFERGEEVFVTYEARRRDGSRFRNTEIHTVRDGRVAEIEVYFGWDLE
jgi:ketosteroid isomerase-like protein